MANDGSANLALLIDGDNVSYKIITGLMTEIPSYGKAIVRRLYGDWTAPNMNGWKATLLDHSIQPIQQFAYTTGKNATDGAMIIDAMDLLYTGRFDGFCLVSSDSDFTRLAARIREQGVTVYGFGERKTPAPFIAACNKFVYFDSLNIQSVASGELGVAASTVHSGAFAAPTPASRGLNEGMVNRTLDSTVLEGLAKAIQNSVGYEGDYANLANVGVYLARISPELNARNYGYERLADLVKASGIAEMKSIDMGDKPRIVLARVKRNARYS